MHAITNSRIKGTNKNRSKHPPPSPQTKIGPVFTGLACLDRKVQETIIRKAQHYRKLKTRLTEKKKKAHKTHQLELKDSLKTGTEFEGWLAENAQVPAKKLFISS